MRTTLRSTVRPRLSSQRSTKSSFIYLIRVLFLDQSAHVFNTLYFFKLEVHMSSLLRALELGWGSLLEVPLLLKLRRPTTISTFMKTSLPLICSNIYSLLVTMVHSIYTKPSTSFQRFKDRFFRMTLSSLRYPPCPPTPLLDLLIPPFMKVSMENGFIQKELLVQGFKSLARAKFSHSKKWSEVDVLFVVPTWIRVSKLDF